MEAEFYFLFARFLSLLKILSMAVFVSLQYFFL